MTRDEIIKETLSLDHWNIAQKLGLVEGEQIAISELLLNELIGLLDELTIEPQPSDEKTVVLLCAILWTYRNPTTIGITDFLIKVLSRIGFGPSSKMIDQNFNVESNRFSGMASYIDMLAISAHHFAHEVLLDDKIYLLTNFQNEVWTNLDKNPILGISAPTSAGKSFIIALKSIHLIQAKPGCIVYVVPTLSLVNQVTLDFHHLLKTHNLVDYEILNTFVGDDEIVRMAGGNKKVYVLTQEKALAAFSQKDNPFKDLRLIVIDEIQNVEKVASEDDQRAKTLYDTIIEFKRNCNPDHIVISGPRIENIGKLGKILFDNETAEIEAKGSPVGSLTYSFSKDGKRAIFKQYSGIVPPLQIEISATHLPPSGTLYGEPFHIYLANFTRLLGDNSKNIIFSPKSDQAQKTAKFVAHTQKGVHASPEIQSLANYISRSVHPKYDLVETLRSRVAFHHGKMPHHVRRVLEKAISRKLVDNVICTTTLMQGVNLPAQNVVIRNPYLYLRKTKTSSQALSDYELANLRGRAGRLMKDFLGRTFILEEEKFWNDENQENGPFTEVKKELSSGYGDIFAKHQHDILRNLNEGTSTDSVEYSFLTTYIRQSALRYPNSFVDRLSDVGINLNASDAKSIIDSLASLSISRDVALNNRYWDPFVLDTLQKNSATLILPTAINESQISERLISAVNFLREFAPRYATKYFDYADTEKVKRLSSAIFCADKWLHEKPLTKILEGDRFDNPENINGTIDLVQNKISYGLPMLLRPLYDMHHPQSSFLRFIELGAYHPSTRKLIEHGVPRETAIFLRTNFLENINETDADFTSTIMTVIKDTYPRLEYWVQVQLEALI